MDDRQVGRRFKAVRLRLELTQDEVGIASNTSRHIVGRIERGQIGRVSIRALRAVASALDIDLDLVVRWRGGDLARIVSSRHAAMHEALAIQFAALPGWVLEPEVSFSTDRERGVIDALAWHPNSRSLLVIELKTELVDVNDLMATMDVRLRLAAGIAAGRGWAARVVGCWVVVAESRTSRRAVARHRLTLRAKFSQDGHAVRTWLRRPNGPIRALGFLPIEQLAHAGAAVAGQRRVRHAQDAPPPLEPPVR